MEERPSTPRSRDSGGGSSPFVLPLLFPTFTAVHFRLARVVAPAAGPAVAAVRRWDWRSHVVLALLPGLAPGVARHGPGWRLALGAFFVTAAVRQDPAPRRRRSTARGSIGPSPTTTRRSCRERPSFLGAAALLLYAGLAPYVITAVSTAGDEPLYLMSTHSLLVDRDFVLENNTQQGDSAGIYWARGQPWAGQGGFLALPVLLLPGYGAARALLDGYPLAGRLGATLVIALCAALAGAVAYRLCRDLGCSRPASFWAWVTLALTPPFIVASGHVYPEVPAVLAGLLGVGAILRMPERPWTGIVGVVASAVALMLLKERFLSLSLVLLAWGVFRLARRSRLAPLALLAGLGLAGAAVVLAARMPALFPYAAHLRFRHFLGWNRDMVVALLGLVADQEFGLLFYAPAWVLAAAGVPALWRRQREATIGLLGLVGGYVLGADALPVDAVGRRLDAPAALHPGRGAHAAALSRRRPGPAPRPRARPRPHAVAGVVRERGLVPRARALLAIQHAVGAVHPPTASRSRAGAGSRALPAVSPGAHVLDLDPAGGRRSGSWRWSRFGRRAVGRRRTSAGGQAPCCCLRCRRSVR